MKIQVVSDLHGYFFGVDPTADMIICCGDIFPIDIDRDMNKSAIWFKESFIPFFDNAKIPMMLVPGNHDFYLQSVINSLGYKDEGYYISKYIKMFCNHVIDIEHCRFICYAYMDTLPNWAFYKSRGDILKETKLLINKALVNSKDKCKVLITHCPPKDDENNTLQNIDKPLCGGKSVHYGSWSVRKLIKDIEPHQYFCGHVHTGNHEPIVYKNTCCQNVSYLGEDYRPMYTPIVKTI